MVVVMIRYSIVHAKEITLPPPPQKKLDTFDKQPRLSAPEHGHNLKIIY
jgi:hypothetical protein